MSQLLVRKVDPQTIRKLKARASAHGVSTEEENRRILRKAPQQCPAFENWLLTLQTEYEADILPMTDAISDQWGRMVALQTLPVIDGLLAATALKHPQLRSEVFLSSS
jgi:plasmid stability protein